MRRADLHLSNASKEVGDKGVIKWAFEEIAAHAWMRIDLFHIVCVELPEEMCARKINMEYNERTRSSIDL